MRNDIKTIKSDLVSLTQRVDNLTEEVDTRLSYLNESMKDDFNDIKTVLSDITDTNNRTCNTTKEKETHTTEPMKSTKVQNPRCIPRI